MHADLEPLFKALAEGRQSTVVRQLTLVEKDIVPLLELPEAKLQQLFDINVSALLAMLTSNDEMTLLIELFDKVLPSLVMLEDDAIRRFQELTYLDDFSELADAKDETETWLRGLVDELSPALKMLTGQMSEDHLIGLVNLPESLKKDYRRVITTPLSDLTDADIPTLSQLQQLGVVKLTWDDTQKDALNALREKLIGEVDLASEGIGDLKKTALSVRLHDSKEGKNSKQQTLFHVACKGGYAKAAGAILKACPTINVNANDVFHQFPLVAAMGQAPKEVFELLFQHGARPLKQFGNKTIIQVAESCHLDTLDPATFDLIKTAFTEATAAIERETTPLTPSARIQPPAPSFLLQMLSAGVGGALCVAAYYLCDASVLPMAEPMGQFGLFPSFNPQTGSTVVSNYSYSL